MNKFITIFFGFLELLCVSSSDIWAQTFLHKDVRFKIFHTEVDYRLVKIQKI